MNTYTVELNDKQIKELIEELGFDKMVAPGAYMIHSLKVDGCNINIYNSKKAVFQGKKAYQYAQKYLHDIDLDSYPQSGSDEVGTGDLFGPICVCASIVNKEDTKLMVDLGVNDSKKLTDDKIIKIAPKLMTTLKYSLLILDNKKYNQIQKTNNLNMIKAKLHNKCYLNLIDKYGELPELIVIDQFSSVDNYYNYLKNEAEVVRNITFETKAESKYLAVAAASIISRFAFLNEMNKMSKKYNFDFPKGANEIADIKLKEFIEKYGKDQLDEVVKLNFKNLEKMK